MSSQTPNTQAALRNRIEDVKPFLGIEEPFTVRDIETEKERVFDVLKLLKQQDALRKVGVEYIEGHNIGKWEWNKREKEKIKEWLEDRAMFPCGHKVTVYNPEWADELACKECHREYSKETVKELL